MNWLPNILVIPIAGLLAMGMVPNRRANHMPARMGMLTTGLAIASLLAALAAAIHLACIGPIDVSFFRETTPVPLCIGIYLDATSTVMFALVSFIGTIVSSYSIQYLRGESGQGRFFRWIAFTLGATLLLVVSCNLVMLTAAWMLTSLGLHQLLTHYPERSWALWAARKKFLISRLGDAMLVAALVLTYICFGTTEYSELFAAANAIHEGTASGSSAVAWIGVLYVLGAMTKSAQFPFHSWLPDTMETPTPVSALMHAGVINAGGFLIIRLSPLVTLSPMSLTLLALIGGITALLGSVVMLTQTSIKRALAYSTVAQMGFMMLQCGLGAFSAAMLHIIAHSAYKAHAFLSCGSVIDNARRTKLPAANKRNQGSAVALLVSMGLAALITCGTYFAIGIDIASNPSSIVFGLVLTLALTQLLYSGRAAGTLGVTLGGLSNALLVAAIFLVASVAVEGLLANSTSHHVLATSWTQIVVIGLVAMGFVAVFSLQAFSGRIAQPQWLKAVYVHAMNGFYIDIPARRVTAWFYRQAAPVQ